MSKFSKALVFLFACIFLAATAQAGVLSLKFNLGGTYLMGGDYNKTMDGWRDYELSVIGPSETFVDNLDKLGLGYQASVEVLYELSPSLAAGIEIGYLRASVTSWFSRTWHNHKTTLTPTLSGFPILLNVHYFMPLSGALKLHATAGGGILISHLNYEYAYEDTTTPYNGTWIPKDKIALAIKAGIGVEYGLTDSIALTFDLLGRFAETSSLTGEYSGIFKGSPYGGTATAYYVDYIGSYPMIVLFGSTPSSPNYQNVREAKFSYSGLSALFGVRIKI